MELVVEEIGQAILVLLLGVPIITIELWMIEMASAF